MGQRSPSPGPSGSGHRKRKRDHGSFCSDRWESFRKGKQRRAPGGGANRQWTFSSRDLSAYKRRLVVVSYNILGVENASKHPDLYYQVSPQHLNWSQRKRRICKELSLYNPGILCFQEVDRFDDLADLLREDGYVGVYKGRTGEARDGCAIFWKENEFSLLHQENIEYRSFGLRDNVAQLCVLKVCHNQSNVSACEDADSSEPTPSQTVVVGNIHVLFNPKRGDIKLGQIRLLLERMHAVSLQWGDAPVVICGDFNSVPQSALYQYLSAPELDVLLYDRRKISGQDIFPLQKRHFSVGRNASRSGLCVQKLLQFKWSEEEIHLAVGNGGCTHLKNPLKLSSAYRGVPGCSNSRDNCGEPLVTSYHSEFMGTVDYIWHSTGIVPVAVVETLPIKKLKKLGGLPSEKWGSDHLALVCEFAFADDGSAS